VRGENGKGANRLLFFGAGNGLALMAKNRNGCLFRRFFFVTFFWHGKESKYGKHLEGKQTVRCELNEAE